MQQCRIFILLAFGLVLVSLMGCAHWPPPVRINAEIQAAGDINLDQNGGPSPVVLRLYQLRDKEVFERSDFFALYDRERSTLGENLIARDEITLQPSEHHEYTKKMDSDARYFGVIAAYRDIDNASWRAVVSLPKRGTTLSLTIGVARLSVSVSTSAPEQ
jgi:type VI secretion system protein VasD